MRPTTRALASFATALAAVALAAPTITAGLTSPVEARDYSSAAPVFTGPAQVIDGNTIVVAGRRIRLFGIDAPKGRQLCDDGWDAGAAARRHLIKLLHLADVQCEQKDVDRYGRSVAICRQGDLDIGGQMVRDGLAWAFTRYAADYVGQEDRARAEKLGTGVPTPAAGGPA